MTALSRTDDAVAQIISELAGKLFHSEQLVASVALTMLDGTRNCALAPGESDAPSTRDLHRNSSRIHTRALADLSLRQSSKLQALSAAHADNPH